jgi:hypothetical protein
VRPRGPRALAVGGAEDRSSRGPRAGVTALLDEATRPPERQHGGKPPRGPGRAVVRRRRALSSRPAMRGGCQACVPAAPTFAQPGGGRTVQRRRRQPVAHSPCPRARRHESAAASGREVLHHRLAADREAARELGGGDRPGGGDASRTARRVGRRGRRRPRRRATVPPPTAGHGSDLDERRVWHPSQRPTRRRSHAGPVDAEHAPAHVPCPQGGTRRHLGDDEAGAAVERGAARR